VSSKTVRRDGRADLGTFTNVGDFPDVHGLLRAEQAWESGPLNPVATTSTGTANARQVLRSSSASGCYARACLRSKNGRSPPDRWNECLTEP
jgi:hypothetical protein